MHTTRTALATLATSTVLGLLAGCGGGPEPAAEEPTASAPVPSEPPTKSEPAEPAEITIEDFAYSDPGPVTPGAEITVENLDDAAHTVTTPDTDDFDVTVAPGESATFTAPEEPGEYPYVCSFHANMTGTLVVG